MPKLTARIGTARSGAPMGCVFCKSGCEEAAVRLLNTTPGMLYAFVPRKVEHRSEKGIKSTVKKVLFPGYVFFQAEENWTPTLPMYYADYILRLLQTNGSWKLGGDDEALARWLLEHDGLLDLSKAYQVGTRVVIQSGPLKELEGIITKVDRHNRNGMVTLELFGRKTNVWLAFELVKEITDGSKPDECGAEAGAAPGANEQMQAGKVIE